MFPPAAVSAAEAATRNTTYLEYSATEQISAPTITTTKVIIQFTGRTKVIYALSFEIIINTCFGVKPDIN